MLAAAFLFNLGQGVLRPSLPLYLQQAFKANYRMVTLIPVVFGAGKWVASLPTGYLLNRMGRRCLMVAGLVVIAGSDIASAMTSVYGLFLGFRTLAGAGWAMFATVATTTMVGRAGARGRAISLLLMSETLGLLVGGAAGGRLYQDLGPTSPFFFEAACMLVAVATAGWPPDRTEMLGRTSPPIALDWRVVRALTRVPGVALMGLTNATLMAIQTGVIVFLYPLYLVERGGLSSEWVGYLVSLNVVGRLLGLGLGGHLSDRWGRVPVMVIGLLGYGVVLGGLTLVAEPFLLGVWSVLLGAGAGVVASLPTAVIGDRVAPALHGIAIGWLRTVTDCGMLFGPLVMGPLADATDLSTSFLLAAAMLGLLAWRCHGGSR